MHTLPTDTNPLMCMLAIPYGEPTQLVGLHHQGWKRRQGTGHVVLHLVGSNSGEAPTSRRVTRVRDAWNRMSHASPSMNPAAWLGSGREWRARLVRGISERASFRLAASLMRRLRYLKERREREVRRHNCCASRSKSGM